MSILIEDCVVVEEYWPRMKLDSETVEHYFSLIKNGVDLPPIKIQQKNLIVIDGRHRLEVHKKAGYSIIRFIFVDIPEKDILSLAIRLNQKNSFPLTKADRESLVVRLRVQNEYPLSYISKIVGLSYSRTQEIWKEGSRNIDPDNAGIDLRTKTGKKKKFTKIRKRPNMSFNQIRYHLKRRFKALNPNSDPQEIDWKATYEENSSQHYDEMLEIFTQAYPDFNWIYPKESRWREYHNEPIWSYENFLPVNLKLYWKEGRVYFKGSVPKKFQQYVQGRIDFTHEIKIPLSPRKADYEIVYRCFPEWNDNYIAELWEKNQLHFNNDFVETNSTFEDIEPTPRDPTLELEPKQP